VDTKPVNGPAVVKKLQGRESKDFKNGDHTLTLIRTEKGKTISESQAECLCERVKYNSWYVQQYCFFLWSHTDKEVSQELLDNQLQLVLDTNEDLFLTEMDELTPTQIGMLKAIASGEKHFNAKDVVETYGLGQPQSITRNKKVLVEKDLVEKHLQDFSFVDPVFELWLKREYNILP
jgi:DNA gyrase/topoisomerase IV subunit A